MVDRYILTPYFLDQSLPQLINLAQAPWTIIEEQLPPGEAQQRMALLYGALAGAVARILREGNRPVSIAGDCCSSLGVAAGLQRAGAQFSLVWLDAHGDFNTWETSPSGFLGGMPLAMLAGRGEQTLVDNLQFQPLAEKSILLCDGRDLDPEEARAVQSSALTHIPEISQLRHHIPDNALYVHMDMDIINPDQAPAQNYVAPGGPSQEEVRDACAALHATGRVVAVSMSTWNPDLDSDGRTRQACMAALASLLGN